MTTKNNKVHNLNHYEQIIQLYEEGEIELDDDGLVELADEIIDFEDKFWGWGLEYIIRRYKPGCDEGPSIECERCLKLKRGECEYTKAIGLADYIYRNLVKELPRDREILCEYLEQQIEEEISEKEIQEMFSKNKELL